MQAILGELGVLAIPQHACWADIIQVHIFKFHGEHKLCEKLVDQISII